MAPWQGFGARRETRGRRTAGDPARRPPLHAHDAHPGHDEELAAGFLFTEGFINDATELGEIRRVRGPKGALEPNAIDIVLNVPSDRLRIRLKRNFVMSSSCGV